MNLLKPFVFSDEKKGQESVTATRNIKRFGKHSDLLKITDDPLAYIREEIRKMNEEYRVGRVEHSISADYNERVEKTSMP